MCGYRTEITGGVIGCVDVGQKPEITGVIGCVDVGQKSQEV